ncbi:MAG: carbohydrate binding domain-containing protein [Firmicutes bacterium]|nr:carbohydrate binding domain-containing protein [Bacillota bacterium]
MRKRYVYAKVTALLCAAALVMTGCGETGAGSVGADVAGISEGADNAGAGGTDGSGSTDTGAQAAAGADGSPAGDASEAPVIYGEPGQLAAYDEEQAHYALKINGGEELHEISDMLYGIFFEDINFAADGGLYAEMVQNRSFEFTNLAQGNEKHAWRDVGDIESNVVTEDAEGGLNCNNTNYMVLTNSAKDAPAGIANKGFLEGMAVEEGKRYRCSVWAKGLDGYEGQLYLAITLDGSSIGEAVIPQLTGEWQYYEVFLQPSRSAHEKVELELTIDAGSVAVDMVSLFPEDTYKGRKNGLRAELAEKLEALQPRFLRFPGGCVVEGVSLKLAYDWKDSIGVDENGEPLYFNGTYGDVAARKQGQNIWTNENTSSDRYPSYMSYGMGFYELFLLAEDLGAVGVPVVNCGLCCMGQSNGRGEAVGTLEFQKYIQDALDLVEFCRGGTDTKWGAVRAAMGHEEPFALKYVGIGNEQWGADFFAHYEAFVEAFAQARQEDPALYGDIELMFTAGVDDGDSGADYMAAYEEAQDWLTDHPDAAVEEFAGAIDHHYYNAPNWFLEHTDYYDEANYSRDVETMTKTRFGGGINVFLGEYAAQSNTLRAALAEAAYMTGLERNGDIVAMAAYAPLFGNITATHWAPDLIWFDNHTVTSSVNYYVQQIFARNAGTVLLTSELKGAEEETEGLKGAVGLGTWNTTAVFSDLKIVDNETGEILGEDDFSRDDFADNWINASDGRWKMEDGKLIQSNAATDTGRYFNIGTVAYFGSADWKNYTMTVTARKNGGSEGFLIPFGVRGIDDNYFWNIGGWSNTVSCLQQVSDGTKSDRISGTVKDCAIKIGQEYELKLVVTEGNVKCYIDDELYIDYDISENKRYESYQVVSTDDTGDIIVKLVNVTGQPKTFAIDIEDGGNLSGRAAVELVAGDSLDNDNILGQEEAVTLKISELLGITEQFNYTVPQYSVTVLRIERD